MDIEFLATADTLDWCSGFSMFAAWVLYALFSLLIFKKKGKTNVWRILGIIGVAHLLCLLFEYATAWHSGYLEEQLASAYRINHLLPAFMLFELLVGAVMAVNIFEQVRNSSIIRRIQLVAITLYLLGFIKFYGLRRFGYSTTIIPGGQSTIMEVGSFYGTLLWLTVIVILGFTLGRQQVSKP